jgi:hypothetical protein
MRPILGHFGDKFSKLYFPGENIVLDEILKNVTEEFHLCSVIGQSVQRLK